jgi:anaerobic magnesium-protoporphyrin IX monomethyl ester cyclase
MTSANAESFENPIDLIANAPQGMLSTYAWFIALHLASLPENHRAAYLGTWLRRLAENDTVQPDVIEDLFHHVELMTAEDQERFVGLFHGYCDARTITSDRLRHLLNRLDPMVRQRLVAAEESRPAPSRREGLGVAPPRTDDRPLIALVVPQFLTAGTFLQPPLCMLLGAARLRSAGYRVQLIDNRVHGLSLERLADAVRDADLVVATTTPYDHIQNYFLDYRLRHAFATVNAIKDACGRTPVVVCGAHGTVRPDIVLQETRADVILKGEFDVGILPVVERILQGVSLEDDPHVCVRSDGALSPNQQGAVVPFSLTNLRALTPHKPDYEVLPAYDLIDFDDYYGDVYVENRPAPRQRWATALATRGCAYDCSFCYNFWDRKVLYREPAAVAEELAWLERAHEVRDLFFLDFHFTQNRKWVMQLCHELRQRAVHVKWSAQARCDAADGELLKEMAAAGCEHLWFGVESYDPSVLRAIEKYVTPETSVQAIANCRRVGIEPHQFILIGLPGETRDSLNTTIAAMHSGKAPYAGVMVATPRFGTDYYTLAKQQYPQLGRDFYSLRSVRGLVANELKPGDLEEALSIFGDRDFIYQSELPQLS